MVRKLFEDREQHILLAHGRGIFNLKLFGEFQQRSWRFFLELFKGHLFWQHRSVSE